MAAEKVVKSTQEQAVASWIQYLNQQRIDELLRGLQRQERNLGNALGEMDELKKSISALLQTNRGGTKGMHGFIAERMQVYFVNARKLLEGEERAYVLLDDNGPVDYRASGIDYQQKFVEKHLSLDAVKKHLEKYPDFVENGGKYQIPRDYYGRMKFLMELPEAEAKKLAGEDYRLWKYVKDFFQEQEVSFSDMEPCVVDYRDTQRNAARKTVSEEEKNIRRIDKEKRDQLYQESKPTSKELGRASLTAAVVEGGAAFCIGVYKKRKSGKKLSEFDEDDWKELGLDTAKSGAKGGVRGASVYAMTNFTATPAAVASSLVTATFGVLAEMKKLQTGKIDQEEFLINSEILCMDVTVSAVSTVLGEVLIPIPILGAILGNVTGMFLYEIAKSNMSEEERLVIQTYNWNRMELEKKLNRQYQTIMGQLNEKMQNYHSLVEWAFSEDANEAFAGSVKIAEYCGVREDKRLRSKWDIDRYFLT